MGIPDTHTMSIHHYSQTYTAVAEESSDNNTEENLPTCTQVFWRTLLVNKKEKMQQRVSELNSFSYEDYKDIVKANNTKIFTPAEIEKATHYYSKDNIIGSGAFGTVYKGILPGNQLIAVKRHGTDSKQGMQEFVNEIKLLSQINNKNVVKLLGSCFESDEYSIVYEYIPNGSLDDHLFAEKKACLLTWNLRLRIAVQVAQVLSYLQNTIRVPIIHRDIKPGNILLDDNYIPIVADFGISKFLPDQYKDFDTIVEDTWESSDGVHTIVMGTYGYADPEYIATGVLTKKSDVYGFGVLLAILLTRRRALSNPKGLPKPKDLLANKFCKKLKEDRLVKILDKQLINEVSMEQLKKVADVAARCLEEKSEDRPSARQVVRLLEDIMGT